MQRQLRLVILFWCETLEPAQSWRILIRQILLTALTCWMLFGDLAGGAGAALVEAGISWGVISSSAGQNLIKQILPSPAGNRGSSLHPQAFPGNDVQDELQAAAGTVSM